MEFDFPVDEIWCGTLVNKGYKNGSFSAQCADEKVLDL